MIYLKLFLTFLQIGAFSFGGGYAMISIIREKCLANMWLTEDAIMNFIAVAESTPGPIAINMATFVGSSQGGLAGSFFATLGVVLPSFIIIIIIASILKNILKYKAVQSVLSGIKPVVTGLIIATAVTMFLSTVLGFTTIDGGFSFNYIGAIILALVILLSLLYKKLFKKKISPIILILFSAVLGILFC